MKLKDEEKAMLAGDFGPAVKWAIEHQLQVGRMFDAKDMVAVSQAHMMACLLYTSPSPRDKRQSRMPSSA